MVSNVQNFDHQFTGNPTLSTKYHDIIHSFTQKPVGNFVDQNLNWKVANILFAIMIFLLIQIL